MAEARTPALEGKRIIVTRAKRQSEPLMERLREKGALPVFAPMVEFAAPDNLAVVDEAIQRMHDYDWVFLTSQNAVRVLEERAEVLRVSLPRAAAKSKIAAVGPATAEAIRNAGLRVDYIAERHQGVALAEELREDIRGKVVLLPRGDRGNPELVRMLEESGARVTEVLAYKTVRPDERTLDLARGSLAERADAVLFFSPSAVEHLRETLGNERFLELSRLALFVAVGPVTEQALRNASVARVRISDDTTVGAVLQVLTNYFSASG